MLDLLDHAVAFRVALMSGPLYFLVYRPAAQSATVV